METKQLITDATIKRKKSTRLDTTEWESNPLGIVQEIENLTGLPNGICTNQNPYLKMTQNSLGF